MGDNFSKRPSNLTYDDVTHSSLDTLVRAVLRASSGGLSIAADIHEALTVRMAAAGLSLRLKQLVASSLLVTAESSSALDFVRAKVGSWLPSGSLVLEVMTHPRSSPECLSCLPASDVINAACLGFYRMNGSGVLSCDVEEFFDDIVTAYGHPLLRILSAPSLFRVWWTPEITPGSLRDVCSALRDTSTSCIGNCRAAAVSYALHAGSGPLSSIIRYFHSDLGEERSQLFSTLSASMDARSALLAASSI